MGQETFQRSAPLRKFLVISLMALVTACQSDTSDDTTPAEPGAATLPEMTAVARDKSTPTCREVFASWAGRGYANAMVDPTVTFPDVADSRPFDATQRVGDGILASRAESVGVVGVGKPGFKSSCTGSLIADRWVLTAAHCGMQIKDKIYVGGYDKALVYVGSLDKGKDKSGRPRTGTFFCHPAFTPAPTYDLALIRLDEPVRDETPVTLALRSDASMAARNRGTSMQVFGFGATAHDPKKVNPVTSKSGMDLASEVLRTGLVTLSGPKCGKVPNNTFCSTTAGQNGGASIGLCRGDSGGPLMLDPDGTGRLRQFGVNSYMAGGVCGEPGVVSGFEDVTRYLDWIAKVTGLPL